MTRLPGRGMPRPFFFPWPGMLKKPSGLSARGA